MAQWSVGAWRETGGTEGERNARGVRELSEGGRPIRSLEGDVDDLCSMHKGLAQFFEVRRMIGSKGVYFYARG